MELTNKELYTKCLELGGKIMKYRNQFIALLPEVNRRQLFLEHKMHTVYEFASKLAGLSHDSVRRVLKIENELADKPILMKIFDQGAIGWSKIEVANKLVKYLEEARVAQMLPSMSLSALRTLERDFRTNSEDHTNFKIDRVELPAQTNEMCFEYKESQASNDLFELPDETVNDAPQPNYDIPFENFTIKLKPETIAQLRVLKHQFEKQSGQPITWEQAMAMMIEKLQNPTPARKKPKCNEKPVPTESTRYVPVAIKNEVLQKTNNLCAKCEKPAVNLHHQIPFAISKNHDSIIPLCKDHHIIEHHKEDTHINRKYQRCRS